MAGAIEVGSDAPAFRLPATVGGEVRFTRSDGGHTLIAFWKSTCPVCVSEIPKLGAVFARHPSAPARIFGVAVGSDNKVTAGDFQKTASFPYPTGIDETRDVRANYRLTRVPTLVLVDPAGKVLRTYVGGRDEMIQAVDAALTALEKGTAVPEYDLVGGG